MTRVNVCQAENTKEHYECTKTECGQLFYGQLASLLENVTNNSMYRSFNMQRVT